MTGIEIETLVFAAAGFLTAVAGYLKAHTATQRLNQHLGRKLDIPPPR